MARALEVLGDVWSFLVLRELFFGETRFEAIQRSLNIGRTSLSRRLTGLVEAKVLTRQAYSERPPRFEYRLTDKGRALYPALVSLMQWGDQWSSGGLGKPLLLTHEPCGKPLRPRLICSNCREPVTATQVEPEAGDGFDRLPHAPRNATRTHSDTALYLHGRACSVARALVVIGDRWSFQILRAAFFGVRRFDDFAHLLSVARNVLTARLAKLVGEGVFEKRQYETRPPRFEYVLSKKGLAFYDSCLLLIRWGDQWTTDGQGAPLRLRHRSCGQLFTAELVCEHCSEPVQARSVRFRDGPGSDSGGQRAATLVRPGLSGR
ncbi:MAG: helix-turn-helix transcriptional regulator [Chitinophagaceae bacterium]|nr:helix-turn-helix transcriptional regulator [Rubrivivax sp.]